MTKCVHGVWGMDNCSACAAMFVTATLQRGQPAKDFLTDIDVLVRERDELRRELSQFDCRRTGGPVSDVGGVHCPPGAPCMRCRLESSERERRTDRALLDRRENVSAKLEETTQECHRMRDRCIRGGVQALEAERQRDTERARADAAEATLARVNADAADMVERAKHLAWVASGATRNWRSR